MWDGTDRRENVTVRKEELHEVIDAAMEKHISSDSHKFVETLMAKEKRKQELWEKVKAQVVGWALIALIGYGLRVFWDDISKLWK